MKLINCKKQKGYYQFDVFTKRTTYWRLQWHPDGTILPQRRYYRRQWRWRDTYTWSPTMLREIKALCRQKWGPE